MKPLDSAIAQIDASIENPTQGIGEDLFHLVSRLTPIINVDLLIRNPQGEILLTWRQDQFYGPGWHIPGGVIRFKETIAERIHAVAKSELDAQVRSNYLPLMVQEVMNHTRDTRGHFISLLYECTLLSELDEKMSFNADKPANNQWRWHKERPDNLIEVHRRIYSQVFN
ncbi:NUDIX domain-containing protein [Neptuniibacter halophilus]|uniref:NUDIX domain-containing protein n=1 Tax=Neptuniibacter halophilus TaxID=651666 RepID=UPI00257315CF|nr:NUDIX domain-containing protein [Neptuniibacter halophilus]